MSHNKIPEPEKKTHFEVNTIVKHVNEINNMIMQMEILGKTDSFDFELEIMEKYPDFYQSHPFLVKKLCKKDDMTMLYKMLENLQDVENGSNTMDNVELKLGTQLANKYVFPNIKK